MSSGFCTHCGAALMPPARFCTACGRAAGHGRVALRGPALERWAPLAVVAAVVAVGSLAVGLGRQSANPPKVPPPRGQAQAPAGMPADHPPIEVPEDVRQVISKMVEAAEAQPDDLDLWRQLGFVQYRAGQVDPAYLAAATATYRHILAKAADDLDALRALGNIAYDRNQPQEAMGHYQRFLEIKPDDLGIQTDLATMLLATRQVDAALAAYQAVLRTDPNYFQAQFNLAIAYRSKGDDALALAALRRAREIAGDDETRQRVDQLLAHVSGEQAAASVPGKDANLHTAVEAVFRSHPIAGSRIDRIDWAGDQAARVVLRGFPMASMPPPVREKFVERIRGGVRAAKADHRVTAALIIELVDAENGSVMETITE